MEPAEENYVASDDSGQVILPLGEPQRRYLVERTEDGVIRLIPVHDYEELPEHIRAIIEDGEAHPERWVRNRPRRVS